MAELALKQDAIPYVKTSAARDALDPDVNDRIYYVPNQRIEHWSGSAWFGDTPAERTATVYSYGASITFDAFSEVALVTATDTNPFTLNAPTNAPAFGGWFLTVDILNSSGGAMGTITWNAVFKLAGSFTNPANTKRRTITFYWDATNWIEVSRAPADI